MSQFAVGSHVVGVFAQNLERRRYPRVPGVWVRCWPAFVTYSYVCGHRYHAVCPNETPLAAAWANVRSTEVK